MNRPCEQVELFVDGELPETVAETFRLHLPDCAHCQNELERLMQLRFLSQSYAERVGLQEQLEERYRPPSRRWRFWAILVVAGPVLALGVALMVRTPSTPTMPTMPKLETDVFLAQSSTRLLEARVTHPGADRHRPLGAKKMGGSGSGEELPHKDLGLMEYDPHGVAVVYLVRNDKGLADKALNALDRSRNSTGLDNDRAVALMLKGEFNEALRLLDGVLKDNPRHAQALWNRGLVLREMKLPLLAAKAFSDVASLKEPGWFEEAEKNAKDLLDGVENSLQTWKKHTQTGEALREKKFEAPSAEFLLFPSARRHFYEAVRSATTREQVMGLLSIAQDLDKMAGGNVLERYVLRAAEADFSRRAPLSQGYRDLLESYRYGAEKKLSTEQQEQLLAQLLASTEEDILLGALVLMEVTERYPEVFEAKVLASGDPWFQMLSAQLGANKAGDWKRAEGALLDALKLCDGSGLEYRCLYLEFTLSALYNKHHQLEPARRYAEKAWRAVRKSYEWELESSLQYNLAQATRLSGDLSQARAYLRELIIRAEMGPEKGRESMIRRCYQDLAVIAMQELQVEEARREMDQALARKDSLGLSGVFALADISRLKPAPGDEARLMKALEKLRNSLTPGEKAISTHVEGRFFIAQAEEQKVKKGRDLLWQAIKEAEALDPDKDPAARRARAYSFTSLLLDAGRRGDYSQALALAEQERGLPLPRKCLLVAAVDSERLLLLAKGVDENLVGHYEGSREQPLPPQLNGVVPEHLEILFDRCKQVDVLARPPLHGRAGLLSSELAWSYLTHTSPPRASRPGPAVHLVVFDVELPEGTSLGRLNPWTPSYGPNEQPRELSGAKATPSRVLAAMKDATEIDLVAHGTLSGYTDASYLELAPESGGSQLSVSAVRQASLEGAPFVVLAACHAAHATYSVADPLSLPAAFIEAGARGVLAATVEIPDQEAQEFFYAVRERMRLGATPAQALREERLKWRKEKKGLSWLDSVLLFE